MSPSRRIPTASRADPHPPNACRADLPNATTLPPAAIDAMGKAFAKLRAAGVKALWRFAYDRAMPGEHYYTAETILGHIAQLRAPFSKQYDALYVLQAGFIGSWGEWHSSQTNLHANASAVSTIVEAELFQLLPPDRKMNVRVPVYKLAGVLRREAARGATVAPPPPAFCAAPTPSRTVCPGAFGGINDTQCQALGCCFFVHQTKPGPQCYTKTVAPGPMLPSPSRSSVASPMGYGVLDAQKAKENTAVARVGYDNDGFMSTTTDGGSW